MDFLSAVGKHVEGTPGRDGLHQSIRKSFVDFTAAIRASAPDFRPYSSPAKAPCRHKTPCIGKIILPYPNVAVDDNHIIYLEEVKELADM